MMSSKFLGICVLLVCFVVINSANVPSSGRFLRNRSRFLARQEIAEDVPSAQTPYPPAGDKPEVEFDPSLNESEVDQGVPEFQSESIPVEENVGGVDPGFSRLTASRGSSRLVQKRQRTKLAPLKQVDQLKSAALLQPLQPVQALQFQQPQLLAQPILLPDGRIVYSILA
ncbi:uncharacterized protein LOC129919704 [Episyrphus balteatus]|uniref:uncharacterized protein LOC129919704 n=1 Tax=Episyrphus balteatus TaxID=286459 RepID=UPI0024859B37|nr:uncharacterized protein LOC129919704 [Episyrphus balteatus]